VPKPRPKFGHGVELVLEGPSELRVFGCYHVSQRNVSTGVLTPLMLREVLAVAAGSAGLN
jgi:uracil-DNA glycosylase